MSKRERRDSERWENQAEQERDNATNDTPRQEGDSLSALKAILGKVAALLKPLQLTAEEATKLVEDLYSSVLAMDLQLAGEADDTRKSSVLAYLERTKITREEGRLVVEFPSTDTPPLPENGSSLSGPDSTSAEASSATDTSAVPPTE